MDINVFLLKVLAAQEEEVAIKAAELMFSFEEHPNNAQIVGMREKLRQVADECKNSNVYITLHKMLNSTNSDTLIQDIERQYPNDPHSQLKQSVFHFYEKVGQAALSNKEVWAISVITLIPSIVYFINKIAFK